MTNVSHPLTLHIIRVESLSIVVLVIGGLNVMCVITVSQDPLTQIRIVESLMVVTFVTTGAARFVINVSQTPLELHICIDESLIIVIVEGSTMPLLITSQCLTGKHFLIQKLSTS